MTAELIWWRTYLCKYDREPPKYWNKDGNGKRKKDKGNGKRSQSQNYLIKLYFSYIQLVLIKVSNAKFWESMCTLSVRRPQPQNTNPQKERKKKIGADNKVMEQIMTIKWYWPTLKTCQSDTIEYMVIKIVPLKYWERNKNPAAQRGLRGGGRISLMMEIK